MKITSSTNRYNPRYTMRRIDRRLVAPRQLLEAIIIWEGAGWGKRALFVLQFGGSPQIGFFLIIMETQTKNMQSMNREGEESFMCTIISLSPSSTIISKEKKGLRLHKEHVIIQKQSETYQPWELRKGILGSNRGSRAGKGSLALGLTSYFLVLISQTRSLGNQRIALIILVWENLIISSLYLYHNPQS